MKTGIGSAAALAAVEATAPLLPIALLGIAGYVIYRRAISPGGAVDQATAAASSAAAQAAGEAVANAPAAAVAAAQQAAATPSKGLPWWLAAIFPPAAPAVVASRAAAAVAAGDTNGFDEIGNAAHTNARGYTTAHPPLLPGMTGSRPRGGYRPPPASSSPARRLPGHATPATRRAYAAPSYGYAPAAYQYADALPVDDGDAAPYYAAAAPAVTHIIHRTIIQRPPPKIVRGGRRSNA